MPALGLSRSTFCASCLRKNRSLHRWTRTHVAAGSSVRQYVNAAAQSSRNHGEGGGEAPAREQEDKEPSKVGMEEDGALTRRLRDMTEEALENGGHSARKAVEEAGFSAELKAQLEQRIAAASFRSSEADLPAAASRHTHDLATAEPWTGTESIHDASLRMLNDAHKPMRLGRPPKIPGVQPPQSVDTGRRRGKDGRGIRLANARDRSTVYATLKEDEALEGTEREQRFQLLKDRFDPHARTIVPGTISGIASLASKRIEDAIARGQFKNIPRGKGTNVERDHNASSPFIDTTEYFMNKIIQRQDIVPPWIERQQELTSAANKFRTRIRADWKRHAARMISSKGGSLQDQIRQAEAYAQAELITNPLKRKQESLTTVDDQGRLSQISMSGVLKAAVNPKASTGAAAAVSEEITAKRVTLEVNSDAVSAASVLPTAEDTTSQTIEVPVHTPTPTVPPAPFPFRDPDWERTETPYFTLAIKELNDKARSYNLQAPDLAKKPYFSLQRELNSCYADIAPQLAGEILDRVRRPPKRVEGWPSSSEKSVLDNIIGGPVRVRDERREKQYGFKQFWKDLWAEKPSSPY